MLLLYQKGEGAMDIVLAQDMQELHEKYTGQQILDMVRKFFELLDDKRYNNEELFLRTYRAYNGAKAGYETIANKAYAEYRSTDKVPLQVARCLLPGHKLFPFVTYNSVRP